LSHTFGAIKEKTSMPIVVTRREASRQEQASQALFEFVRQQRLFQRRARNDQPCKRQQLLIHRLHIEEVIQDAVVYLHKTGEERSLLRRYAPRKEQKAMLKQWRRGLKPAPRFNLLLRRATKQVQDQIHYRALARHVILQIGIKFFVLQVQFRSEA